MDIPWELRCSIGLIGPAGAKTTRIDHGDYTEERR
jgi:hypothetical protein